MREKGVEGKGLGDKGTHLSAGCTISCSHSCFSSPLCQSGVGDCMYASIYLSTCAWVCVRACMRAWVCACERQREKRGACQWASQTHSNVYRLVDPAMFGDPLENAWHCSSVYIVRSINLPRELERTLNTKFGLFSCLSFAACSWCSFLHQRFPCTQALPPQPLKFSSRAASPQYSHLSDGVLCRSLQTTALNLRLYPLTQHWKSVTK